MAEHPENPGGLGGESAHDPKGIRDTRLEARAVRERWPLPEHVRVKVLNRLVRILDDDADHGAIGPPGHREVIAAGRALIAADKLNLEQAKMEMGRTDGDAAMRDVQARMDTYADPDDPGDRGRAGPDPGVVPPPG